MNGVGAVVALLAQRHLMGDLAWLGLVAYESSNWLSFVPTVALFSVFPDGLYQRPYERRLVIATGVVLLPLLLIWMISSPTLVDPNVIWYPVSARVRSPCQASLHWETLDRSLDPHDNLPASPRRFWCSDTGDSALSSAARSSGRCTPSR